MMLKIQSFNHTLFPLIVVLLISAVIFPIHGLDSRKLDETPVPGPVGDKCSTCVTSVLPPPPPPACPPPPPPLACPPPPPPPACSPPAPPALPPPFPEKPPSGNCPSCMYITGPPDDLYPTKFGSAGRTSAVGWSVLIGCGILGLSVRLGY